MMYTYTWFKRLRQRYHGHAKPLLRSSMMVIPLVLLFVACTRPPHEGKLYALGQTAELDGWRVTVHSFSALPGDASRQSAHGHVFCAIEVTLENLSDQIRFFMPERQMTLADADGKSYALDHDAGVVAARSRGWTVPDGEMSIGEKAHGAAAYQIPSESRGVRWVFRSSLFPWARRLTFVLGKVPQP